MSFHKQLRDKLLTKEAALGRIIALRGTAKKIVFTNGCFDILHPGHVDYLCQARDLGDYLIVGLNSDVSVKALNKGPNRPVNNESSRGLVLAGLACVDAVILFEEDTPRELISFLKPDVLVKGSDYKVEDIAGADVVIANGGKVVTIPLVQGFSTTSIIQKLSK